MLKITTIADEIAKRPMRFLVLLAVLILANLVILIEYGVRAWAFGLACVGGVYLLKRAASASSKSALAFALVGCIVLLCLAAYLGGLGAFAIFLIAVVGGILAGLATVLQR